MEKTGNEMVEKKKKNEKCVESSENLLYLVDHCFPMKGKGTVITGTVLRGKLSVNDTVFIPHLQLERKIKSIQMFKKPTESAVRGDRVGVLVTQFDAKLMERGIICAKGTVPEITSAVIRVKKIPFFKLPIKSGAKYHVTVGHNTVMATFTFFGEEGIMSAEFNAEKEYIYKENLEDGTEFAVAKFETPIFVPTESILIASKLDIDIHTNTCRLAFSGTVLKPISEENSSELKNF